MTQVTDKRAYSSINPSIFFILCFKYFTFIQTRIQKHLVKVIELVVSSHECNLFGRARIYEMWPVWWSIICLWEKLIDVNQLQSTLCSNVPSVLSASGFNQYNYHFMVFLFYNMFIGIIKNSSSIKDSRPRYNLHTSDRYCYCIKEKRGWDGDKKKKNPLPLITAF